MADVFLRIHGVDGSCRAAGFEGAIEVAAYRLGFDGPSGGSGATVSLVEVELVGTADLPELAHRVASAEPIVSAWLFEKTVVDGRTWTIETRFEEVRLLGLRVRREGNEGRTVLRLRCQRAVWQRSKEERPSFATIATVDFAGGRSTLESRELGSGRRREA
ncbi:MAG: hypothetical protein IPM29_15800 [Planctomycetes bacterium]|nr:hypothetical protein [Planctomycetota bacterium]